MRNTPEMDRLLHGVQLEDLDIDQKMQLADAIVRYDLDGPDAGWGGVAELARRPRPRLVLNETREPHGGIVMKTTTHYVLDGEERLEALLCFLQMQQRC